MEEEFKERIEMAKSNLKQHMREKALTTAEHMQPNSSISYNQSGLQEPKRNVVQLLKDAETIYNWLIKDL